MYLCKKKLIHGSKCPGLTSLNVEFSDPDNPYGPAVYCTEDVDVALSLNGPSKTTLYHCTVSGPWEGVIEFDRPLNECSALAAEAILSLFRRFRLSPPNEQRRVDHVLISVAHDLWARGGRFPYKRYFQRHLAESGVWMLKGEMCPTIASGLQDRGVQYLILDDDRIGIVQQVPKPYSGGESLLRN